MPPQQSSTGPLTLCSRNDDGWCSMKSNSATRAVLFFLAPALIAIGVFFFIPVIAAFILSFTDFDIYSLGNWRYARFVGMKNYNDLVQDPLFWKALGNTFYFLFVGGPLSIAAS